MKLKKAAFNMVVLATLGLNITQAFAEVICVDDMVLVDGKYITKVIGVNPVTGKILLDGNYGQVTPGQVTKELVLKQNEPSPCPIAKDSTVLIPGGGVGTVTKVFGNCTIQIDGGNTFVPPQQVIKELVVTPGTQNKCSLSVDSTVLTPATQDAQGKIIQGHYAKVVKVFDNCVVQLNDGTKLSTADPKTLSHEVLVTPKGGMKDGTKVIVESDHRKGTIKHIFDDGRVIIEGEDGNWYVYCYDDLDLTVGCVDTKNLGSCMEKSLQKVGSAMDILIGSHGAEAGQSQRVAKADIGWGGNSGSGSSVGQSAALAL